MPDSPPPKTLAWLRHAASCGQRGAQLTLHTLERLEALEADATEQSRSSSFCNEAIVRRLEALEAAQQQPPAPQSAPPAAPAGGLVEKVAAAMHPNYPRAFRGEARAAIREMAAWLDRRGQHGCSLLLREEADR